MFIQCYQAHYSPHKRYDKVNKCYQSFDSIRWDTLSNMYCHQVQVKDSNQDDTMNK